MAGESFLTKFMGGEQVVRAMTGSMAASELGALAHVCDVLLKHGNPRNPRVERIGEELLAHLAQSAEWYLHPERKETK